MATGDQLIHESGVPVSQRPKDRGSAQADTASDFEKARLDRYQRDTSRRRGLVVWIGAVCTFWLFGVYGVVCWRELHGELGSAEVIALLCTTTANVLGLAYIMLRGHFRGQ